MRVTDKTIGRNYLKYLNGARYDYEQTTNRIATGKRFTQLSDDVSAGSRVLSTRNDRYKAEKQLDNIKSINEELASAESSMTSINDILSKISSEILNKAVNGTNDQTIRDAYANEVQNLRNELLQFANSKYKEKFLFGGTNASGAPFSIDETTGRLKYNGVLVDDIKKDADGYYYEDATGNRQDIPMDDDVYLDIGLGIKMAGTAVDPSTGFKISYSGIDIMGFGKDADGNSNNLFNALVDIEVALRSGDVDKVGQLNNKLQEQRNDFGKHLTDMGSKTQYLDTMEQRLTNTVDGYTSRIQDLMGTVPGQEETTLMMNDYTLKAVLQLGSRVLPISLMDYLN